MRAPRLSATLAILVLLTPAASAVGTRGPMFTLDTGGIDFWITVKVWPGTGEVKATCDTKVPVNTNWTCGHTTKPAIMVTHSDEVVPIWPGPTEAMDALLALFPGAQPPPATQTPLRSETPTVTSGALGDEPIVIEVGLHWGATTEASWARTCVQMSSKDKVCSTSAPADLSRLVLLLGPEGESLADDLADAVVQNAPMGGSPPPAPVVVLNVHEAVLAVLGASQTPAPLPSAPVAAASPDVAGVEPLTPGDATADATVWSPGRLAPTPERPDALGNAADYQPIAFEARTSGGLGDNGIDVSFPSRAAPEDASSPAAGHVGPRPPWSAASPRADALLQAPDATAPRAEPVAPAPPRVAPAPVAHDARLTLHGAQASASSSVGPALAVAGAAIGALWALALVLYSRLKAARLGDQRTREEILDAVRAAPGLTPRAIAQRIAKHENTVRYHLRMLEKGGHISARAHGSRMHYFMAGEASEQGATVAATLRTRAARLLYEAARSTPGIGVAEASALVGVHRTTLHYHASKLEQAGLLALQKDADGLRLYPRAS